MCVYIDERYILFLFIYVKSANKNCPKHCVNDLMFNWLVPSTSSAWHDWSDKNRSKITIIRAQLENYICQLNHNFTVTYKQRLDSLTLPFANQIYNSPFLFFFRNTNGNHDCTCMIRRKENVVCEWIEICAVANWRHQSRAVMSTQPQQWSFRNLIYFLITISGKFLSWPQWAGIVWMTTATDIFRSSFVSQCKAWNYHVKKQM